ncbi:ureidoglycolate lyase [Treponema primitia]|uniref:ureidoglycolate lyase n=1 Tax=Treponema primitia TaxID=88058 RepID=UPI000255547A|nr:ureidoglycolate lyase [Treponema primitia]
MKKILPVKLSIKSFELYGEVIGTHNNKPDMRTDTFDYWHNEIDLSNFTVKTTCGWLDLKHKGFTITNLQRLPKSDEAYLATDSNISFIPVAPNDPETNLPDYKKFKVFTIEKGMGVIVKKDIWHWAPFPLSQLCTFVLLVRSNCFIEDKKPLATNPKNVFVIDCEPYEIGIKPGK